jgi:hypothetical protein
LYSTCGAEPMADDLGLLVIDQDLSGHPAKIFETLNQAFVGMFGVLARHRHKMEAARVAQGVDREMHLLLAARHQRAVFGPIVLQLFARCGLEAHRRPRLAQWPLGPDVIAQDTHLPAIAAPLEFAQYHHRVPHSGRQQSIDLRLIRVQFAFAVSRRRPPSRRCSAALARPAHRAWITPNSAATSLT